MGFNMSELRVMTTQVPESLFVDVEKIAKEQDRSKSWILRQALQNYVLQCKNKIQSQPKSESEADRQAKQEFFALVREARKSGETFEPPVRENVWKPNPVLETD